MKGYLRDQNFFAFGVFQENLCLYLCFLSRQVEVAKVGVAVHNNRWVSNFFLSSVVGYDYLLTFYPISCEC